MTLRTAVLATAISLALTGTAYAGDGVGAGADAGSNEVFVGAYHRRSGIGLSSGTTGGVPCEYLPATPDGPAAGEVVWEYFDGVRYEMWVANCGDAAIYYWQSVLTPDQLLADITDLARKALPPLRPNWIPASATARWTWVRWPNYVWLGTEQLQPLTVTATTPGLSITATAEPTNLRVAPGDGTTIDCAATARPPTEAEIREIAGDAATGVCSFRYATTSAKQPGEAFSTTIELAWRINWAATDGTSGQLAGLQTSVTTPIRVAQMQAINTGT